MNRHRYIYSSKMFKSLVQPLNELVDDKFVSAEATGSLTFAPSSLAILHTDSGLPVRKSVLSISLLPDSNNGNSSNSDTAHL